MKGAINGLIRSARLGMAPTLISNALVAWVVTGNNCSQNLDYGVFFTVLAMGLCFFLYGMWENDRVDAKWDARFRPSRPVPSGEVSVWTLRVASGITGLSGLIIASILLGEPFIGVFLLIVITLYNWLHKAFAWSIILMGFCRGFWVAAAMLSFVMAREGSIEIFGDDSYSLSHYYIYSLTFYTILASWFARGEACSIVRKKIAGFLLPAMCLHDAVWLFCMSRYSLALVATACYVLIFLLIKLKHRTT